MGQAQKVEHTMGQIQVCAFYDFFPIEKESLQQLEKGLNDKGSELELRGLFILAEEGCNTTVCGTPRSVETFKKFVRSLFPQANFNFKDSFAAKKVFRRFKVDLREDIVNLGHHIDGVSCKSPDHLTPEQWNKALKDEVILIDVRNDYETKLGKFKGAIDPQTSCFSEFPEFVRELKVPKDQKVLMYCTGGIRCEKAAIEMRRQGFSNVYQLDGGILNYLEHYPHQAFQGECFVFDERVAVTQELEPSQVYRLCPHCGDPGDLRILCSHCEKPTIVCKNCAEEPGKKTCSKNCAYHHRCNLGLQSRNGRTNSDILEEGLRVERVSEQS